MKVINLTEKQASNRYGKSPSWFQKRRNKKIPPFFHKCPETKRIYYPLQETDRWFCENIIMLNKLE